MNTKIIWITPNAEELIAWIARVSSSHQDNPDYLKLIKYLIRNKHWSPFEMASMCVEIKTTRAIAPQILRHRSFSFQEFSQRYAVVEYVEDPEIRMQGETNRQGGEELCEDEELKRMAEQAICNSVDIYNKLILKGVAKESARMILPQCAATKIYMAGTLRSWIHYLELRTDPHTQKEHRLIADDIKAKFITLFPNISGALGWT